MNKLIKHIILYKLLKEENDFIEKNKNKKEWLNDKRARCMSCFCECEKKQKHNFCPICNVEAFYEKKQYIKEFKKEYKRLYNVVNKIPSFWYLVKHAY